MSLNYTLNFTSFDDICKIDFVFIDINISITSRMNTTNTVEQIMESVKSSFSKIPNDKIQAMELYIRTSQLLLKSFSVEDGEINRHDVEMLHYIIDLMQKEVYRQKRNKYLKYGLCGSSVVLVAVGFYKYFK